MFKRFAVATLLASTLAAIPLLAGADEGRFIKGTGATVYADEEEHASNFIDWIP